MKMKHCGEEEAYTLMRRQAMSRQQKLIQVAEQHHRHARHARRLNPLGSWRSYLPTTLLAPGAERRGYARAPGTALSVLGATLAIPSTSMTRRPAVDARG